MYKRQNKITSSQEIFRDICDKIETLEYEPGSRISENEIAGLYGVSRTVIRGIFAILREWGLIDVYPQRGTYVSKIDISYIKDMQFVRGAVEDAIMTEVMKIPDRSLLIRSLKDNLEAQEQYRFKPKYEKVFFDLDGRFHQLFVKFVHRDHVFNIVNMDSQAIQFHRWRYLEVETLEMMERIITQHTTMCDLVISGDTVQLRKILKEHIMTISDASSDVVKKYPQYFIS